MASLRMSYFQVVLRRSGFSFSMSRKLGVIIEMWRRFPPKASHLFQQVVTVTRRNMGP